MEEQLSTLKSQLAIVETEWLALKGGRKSASARLRKSLMNVKNSSHSCRALSTKFVKELPTKSRKAVVQVPPTESEVKVEELKVEPIVETVKVVKKRVKKASPVSETPVE